MRDMAVHDASLTGRVIVEAQIFKAEDGRENLE